MLTPKHPGNQSVDLNESPNFGIIQVFYSSRPILDISMKLHVKTLLRYPKLALTRLVSENYL